MCLFPTAVPSSAANGLLVVKRLPRTVQTRSQTPKMCNPHTYIKFVRYDIDNTPGQPQASKGKRSFRPASTLIFALFHSLVVKLKDCGLANKHHNILLARGASWLKSAKGVSQQTPHRWSRACFVYAQFPSRANSFVTEIMIHLEFSTAWNCRCQCSFICRWHPLKSKVCDLWIL